MNDNKLKLSAKKVNEILSQYGFKILENEEYKNNCTPINCVNINNGYRYNIILSNLQMGYKPSLWKRNNSCNFEYNIKKWLNENAPNIKYCNYELCQKKSKKITLIHLICECGNLFTVELSKMVNGYYKFILCNSCKKKLNVSGIKKTSQENIDIIEQIGYKIIDKENLHTVNATTSVDVIDKDGFKGQVSARLIKAEKHFSTFSIRNNKKYFLYNVNLWLSKNYSDTKCVEIIDLDRAKFICGCGEEMILTVKQFRYGKTRCDKCTNRYSSLENKVMCYLEDNNIKYIPQYKIEECRDKLPLPFDFWLKDYNVLIETDGKQHFKTTFGRQKDFEITKKHDKIKDDYCKKHNIRLIRIPYYEFESDNWIEYLQEFVH